MTWAKVEDGLAIQYYTILYNKIQYNTTIQYNAIQQFKTKQYNTYYTKQNNTTQCNTLITHHDLKNNRKDKRRQKTKETIFQKYFGGTNGRTD